MLIAVPGMLDAGGVTRVRSIIDDAAWIDGNATSGHQSALAKQNVQLPEASAEAREAGALVLDALTISAEFVAAALPAKVYPPLFSRYAPGDAFANHVDAAVRLRRGSDFRVRSDLSATLFLEPPDAYDGGELVIEDLFGEQRIKLAAGDLVLYPASSVHRVAPITRGRRVAAFFWIQSMVRDDGARRILFDLDRSVQDVAGRLGADADVTIRLTGTYHNLLRRWVDA
ncbi:Fe2+-dependent dioxygenase [uncultured Sphingomonas sp.]|uniref:Fe2+-dependent dioxygenase n=1 Tax=uncultured Sphingomonas sp. TaxID=158754 RepID=UPI0035CB3F27